MKTRKKNSIQRKNDDGIGCEMNFTKECIQLKTPFNTYQHKFLGIHLFVRLFFSVDGRGGAQIMKFQKKKKQFGDDVVFVFRFQFFSEINK